MHSTPGSKRFIRASIMGSIPIIWTKTLLSQFTVTFSFLNYFWINSEIKSSCTFTHTQQSCSHHHKFGVHNCQWFSLLLWPREDKYCVKELTFNLKILFHFMKRLNLTVYLNYWNSSCNMHELT